MQSPVGAVRGSLLLISCLFLSAYISIRITEGVNEDITYLIGMKLFSRWYMIWNHAPPNFREKSTAVSESASSARLQPGSQSRSSSCTLPTGAADDTIITGITHCESTSNKIKLAHTQAPESNERKLEEHDTSDTRLRECRLSIFRESESWSPKKITTTCQECSKWKSSCMSYNKVPKGMVATWHTNEVLNSGTLRALL